VTGCPATWKPVYSGSNASARYITAIQDQDNPDLYRVLLPGQGALFGGQEYTRQEGEF
jgi:hypothetical protein